MVFFTDCLSYFLKWSERVNVHIFDVRWLSAIEIAESGELFRNFALNLTANVDNSLQVLAKEFLIIPLQIERMFLRIITVQ